MIYFVRHVETSLIKIGCTSSVAHRIREIAHQHGALELLGMMQGNTTIEKQLHERFADYNTRPSKYWGVEWFSPAQSIVDYIATNTAITDNSFGMQFARWYASTRQRKFTSNILALLLKKYGVENASELPHRNVIAKGIGIHPQVLNDWFRKGYIRQPRPHTTELICKFLRCEVGDLLYIEWNGEKQTA